MPAGRLHDVSDPHDRAVSPETAPELFVSMAKGGDVARAEKALLEHGE